MWRGYICIELLSLQRKCVGTLISRVASTATSCPVSSVLNFSLSPNSTPRVRRIHGLQGINKSGNFLRGGEVRVVCQCVGGVSVDVVCPSMTVTGLCVSIGVSEAV
jgi:hypothetical protein